MFHIEMDMHKKFSRVEIINGEGQAIDKRVLFHHDQEKNKRNSVLQPGHRTLANPHLGSPQSR